MQIRTDNGTVTDGNIYWVIEPGTKAHEAVEKWQADRLKARKAVDRFITELKRDFMRPFKQAGFTRIQKSGQTHLRPLSFRCWINKCDEVAEVAQVAHDAPKEWRDTFNYTCRQYSRMDPQVDLETKLWRNNKTGRARSDAFWKLYNAVPETRDWFKKYVSGESPPELFRRENGQIFLVSGCLFRPMVPGPWLFTVGDSKSNQDWNPNDHRGGFRKVSMSELWAIMEDAYEGKAAS